MKDLHAASPDATFSGTQWEGLRIWINAGGQGTEAHLHEYFAGISRARYITRRIFRIFDEEAKATGMDPLQHQALIQVTGRDHGLGIRVSSLANWLDVPPALASRIVKDLEKQGLVERRATKSDKRVKLVSVTEQGRNRLASISQAVHAKLAYFQSSLTKEDRRAALTIFAFYVGVPIDERVTESLDELIDRAEERN